ncbi:3-oxoacyl-ACP synthase III family protein [Sulfuricurvum sp.]|uniref:3-oxoacyl-ACP synthase III family protein n=1 Tax=Sulfuricurvum sp. TaxID=2025608 RepID=UPI0026070573|nr:ketoacyl-ACP synthase III [Sulfuricurvum sp.]MDD2267536.1 ketoacyl-ACP synthase III [Sulfuricurvum sp.]MDD2783690.1 ketoacyl-ACP synthase III [Sulfuricurvum sp.]
MKITYTHAAISRIVTVIPNQKINNHDLPFDDKTKKKIIKMTGVETRHVLDEKTSLLPLYIQAAQEIFKTIDPQSIDAVIVVSQTPEYRLPTTANVLHGLLDLKKDALAFDINQGCSGYIYGLSQAFALLETASDIKRILLFDGDAISKISEPENKSTAFLFGDAASVTLCERTNDSKSYFVLKSDGHGYTNLIVPDGGIASPLCANSYEKQSDETGNTTSASTLYMNGTEIFNFTVEEVPSLLEEVYTLSNQTPEMIDVFCLHQANRFMLDFLADKMGIAHKTPINIDRYGNSSSVSIPLLICDMPEVCTRSHALLAGFGVGYSMSAALLDLSNTQTMLKGFEA